MLVFVLILTERENQTMGNSISSLIEEKGKAGSEKGQKNVIILKKIQNFLQGNTLTKREKEIYRYLSTDKTREQICNEMYISLNTLKKHSAHIFFKTKLKNRKAIQEYEKYRKLVKFERKRAAA